VSNTARQFVILRNWCDWQDERTAAGHPPHPHFFEQCAKLKRDAAFIIGWMA